jgi:ComF family protein
LCGNCRDWQTDIEGIRSPFRYEGVIRQAILQLKYRNLRAIISDLAVLLADYLVRNPMVADVIVPVPLHKKRFRERGYNQSVLLARELGLIAGLTVVETCLIRTKYTPPQARTATVEERRDNVVDVFACRGNEVEGKNTLLIDDVATSGATMNACAKVLRTAGARSVWGLALAREI